MLLSLDQKVHTHSTLKGRKWSSFKENLHWFFFVAGVNIGGAGSYVYDNPTNDAPAAGSLETDGKPQEEEKKASARGPVKGETSSMQKQKTLETCQNSKFIKCS